MLAPKVSGRLAWALGLLAVAGCNCGPASPTDDAGSTPDAAVQDSGQPDAGAFDAGPRDAGSADAGVVDGGAPDGGAADAGGIDAGVPDAGPADAGSCGDAVVNLAQGEQCDQGAQNGAADGGCSATCQLTAGNYLNEVEPNDTQATGNSLAGYAGAVGQLSPAGDVDWYTANVTVPGSSITARVDDGLGGCPGGFDFQLSLYSPGGALLALGDAGAALPACPAIVPDVTPAATHLPVGTYALQVSNPAGALQPPYVLTVRVNPPGCGDGVLPEGNKQCDPGPIPVAGCSAACQFTGDFLPETEPNDTQATANPLGTHAGFIGAIQPAGDLDDFSFQVPGPNSLVDLQTSDGIGGCPFGFDSILSFYDSTGNLLLQDDNGGVGLCSRIAANTYRQAMNLPGGTYRARVEFKGNNSTYWEYVLTVAVSQPACGDGIVEPGEQCDDGALNGTSSAGCSGTCQAIAPWEIEPNDSLATATPQWTGFSNWKASISPLGDHDYFAFTLAASGHVTLTTHDVDAPTVCSSDTVLHLVDSMGTELTFDDDSGPGPGDPSGGKCSKINLFTLPAGTFFAWVQRYSDTKVIPSYQLDLLVQ